MRHRGHPTSTIDVDSGLLGQCIVSSGSDETHEPSIDMSEENEVETFGDSTGEFALGGDKFSFNSSFGLFALRLMFLFPKQSFCKIFYPVYSHKTKREWVYDLTQFVVK